MYGHESKPSRVYAYGAKPPEGESDELVHEQIDAAWRYRNDLVALELDRRERSSEIVRDHEPRLVALDDEIEALEERISDIRDRIRDANSEERRRKERPALKAEVEELLERKNDLYREHKELRTEVYGREAVEADMGDLDEAVRREQKRLRAESGLYWGTYLTVEQGLGGIRSGAPPRFMRRADWDGQVAVQIQGGASWDELMIPHGEEPASGMAWIEGLPLPPNAKPGGRRSRRPYRRLWIRVGSEGAGNRTPVWATVRFVRHRLPPEDARIKWVRLVRRREGTAEQWSVQFVVARDEWGFDDTGDARGTVGVDLGWRRLEDGSLRVAYAVGDDGGSEELVIPADQIGRETKAYELASIRDREVAEARDALASWLKGRDVPDWLAEDTETLTRWTSQARLAALAIRWRDQRFPGDEEAYEALEEWRRQDKHLYDWQGSSRAGFRRWRKDHYRRFAARLRWRYETVVVEDADWRDLMSRPHAEDDTGPGALDRRAEARIAAPGLLRECLRHGHPDVREAESAYTTRECSVCGAGPADDWDAASELIYRCAAGHEIDQDRNAALNLLAAASGEVATE